MSKNSSKDKLLLLGTTPATSCHTQAGPAQPSSAPQLLELFEEIPRLPDSSLWGHFLSNRSRLSRDWQLSRSPQETLFTLTVPSWEWSPPFRSTPGSPVFLPSFEIYIKMAASSHVCHYRQAPVLAHSGTLPLPSTMVCFQRGSQSCIFKGRSRSSVSTTSHCFGNKIQIPQMSLMAAATGPGSLSIIT